MSQFSADSHQPIIGIAPRLRKSPYYDATIRYGAKAFTVYNHMLMPLYYESSEKDYWHLMTGVTLWDVAAERQVQISGPDAYTLVRLMTPRNLEKFPIGLCKYLPIVDQNGGMINDPLALRISEDTFWLSLADSDVLLWAKGLALGKGLNVEIMEPDVSPLALQGPRADELAAEIFGNWIYDLKFFRFKPYDYDGIPLIIARSGWSKQGGLELYLKDSSKGEELWERIMKAGENYAIKPATPNAHERVESGLLSHGTDMTLANNPFELGLDKYCDVEQDFDFIGKAALKKIKAEGVKQKLVGVAFETQEKLSNEHFWNVSCQDENVGYIASAAYSPRLSKTIAMAMLKNKATEIETELTVHTPKYGDIKARVVPMPFV